MSDDFTSDNFIISSFWDTNGVPFWVLSLAVSSYIFFENYSNYCSRFMTGKLRMKIIMNTDLCNAGRREDNLIFYNRNFL